MSTHDDVVKIHQPHPRYKVLDEIASRWSPRYYSDEQIPDEQLNSIFEAARWTPSANNRQPWYFYHVNKGTSVYEKLFSTLETYNQSWAGSAPLLILGCISENDNIYAQYDLGAAVISLILQAQSMGIYSRQMALFDKSKAKKLLGIEKSHEPYIVVAMGKLGDFNSAPGLVIEYEQSSRPRKENIVKKLV